MTSAESIPFLFQAAQRSRRQRFGLLFLVFAAIAAAAKALVLSLVLVMLSMLVPIAGLAAMVGGVGYLLALIPRRPKLFGEDPTVSAEKISWVYPEDRAVRFNGVKAFQFSAITLVTKDGQVEEFTVRASDRDAVLDHLRRGLPGATFGWNEALARQLGLGAPGSSRLP